MPISGLVIDLDGHAGAAEAALHAVRADRRFTLGDEAAERVPVVLETESHRESRVCLEWLEGLPGVTLVQVAYVDQSDIDAG